MHLRSPLRCAGLLVLAAACTDTPPVRLVAGRADTVIVHNRQPVPLPVFGFAKDGDTVTVRNLRFHRVSGDPIRVTSRGMATCDRAGDATVEVSHRRVSTRFLLMCRPIVGFRFAGNPRMILGGPTIPLQLDAVGVDGESVFPIVGIATVEDSSVVTVQGMDLAARGPGRTDVRIEAGDCRTEISVEVNERVRSLGVLEPYQEYVTPVSIVAGETQTWPIAKGDYEIEFEPADSTLPSLVIGAAGAQCMGSTARGYHCLALEPAKLVLRHPGVPGTVAAVTGELTVRSNARPTRRSMRSVRYEPRRRTPPCKDFRYRGLPSASHSTPSSQPRQ